MSGRRVACLLLGLEQDNREARAFAGVGQTLQTRAAAALAGGARPERQASASTRSGSALGHGRSDRRREVGHHAHLGEHGAEHGVAVEPLDLPVAQVPEVGARHVDLRSRRLDDAGRGLQRPEEGALNRQLHGDRVAKHVDAVQLTMDIGECLGDPLAAFLMQPRSGLDTNSQPVIPFPWTLARFVFLSSQAQQGYAIGDPGTTPVQQS